MRWNKLLSSLVLLASAVALAGTPRTWQGEIDEVPTWITVVPRGHEIDEALLDRPWWAWGNATSDAYLFAFETPENVRLILSFATVGEVPEASLYVREGGAAPVPFTLAGDRLDIDAFPYYRLRPRQGGWLIDGKANYDLDAWFDGVEGKVPNEPDGVVDYEEAVGALEPGVPLWGYSEMVNDPHPTWGYPRYGVSKRMEGAPPFKVAAPMMPQFPYFGLGERPSHWFDENPHPIFYRFDKAELDLSSFTGFQIGGMYLINSISLPPNPSFETPFAFYNFLPDSRLAQLSIRGSHTPPKDRYRGLIARGVPKTDFRYSWKTWDNNRWQYGLHLAGTHPYTDLVRIGSEEFYSVEPEELPGWIVEKEWPVVSFVEAVDGFHGSEGIYFYSAQARPVWPWLIGIDMSEPEFFRTPYLQNGTVLGTSPDETLPVGFRGEYGAAYERVPTLYLSPIDNRLHLLGAEGGVWNLGDNRVLRSHNLFGSLYTNGWTRERIPDQEAEPVEEEFRFVPGPDDADAPLEDVGAGPTVQLDPVEAEDETVVPLPRALPGTIEVALYAVGDYLIYFADGEEFVVVRSDYALSDFEMAPPQDEASWRESLDRLEPFRGLERDPANVRAWLDAFPGPAFRIEGAGVDSVSVSSDGLNFALRVPEGGAATSDLSELDGDGLEAGTYSLRYDLAADAWSLDPAVRLLPEVTLEVEGNRVFIDSPNTLELVIANPGNLDLSGRAELVVGDTTVETWQDLHVAGNARVVERVDWLPFVAASASAVLTWNGESYALGDLEAVPRPRAGGFSLLQLSFGGSLQMIVVLLVVAATGLVFRQVVR